MSLQGTTTSIVLDTRRALKDGTFPVKLRVTFQRKQKYYPTGYSFSSEDFEKVMSAKPGKVLKDYKLSLQAIEQEANDAIFKLTSLSFAEFERSLHKNTSKHEVFCFYDEKIAALRQEGRVGTADSYQNARNSLWSFIHGVAFTERKGITRKKMAELTEAKAKYTPLPFTSITVQFLKDYESWMRAGGRSVTTIGIYLRTLRALYNDAIASGDAKAERYPFGKRKFQIPSGVNVKKALSLADIDKLFSYNTKTESEARSRDLWLFSYLCNGINIKDMAMLQYKQVEKDTITFIRAKTERSTRHQSKAITAVLAPEAQEVIKRWGNKPEKPDEYIFPILTQGLTPEAQQARIKQSIKTINTYIKRIAEAVGIEKNVTTYTARHSYSTVLKQAGVSTAFISEALGHTSEKTTQSYLDSFETEAKRQVVSKLTAFKK